jgi:hypothetical protein
MQKTHHEQSEQGDGVLLPAALDVIVNGAVAPQGFARRTGYHGFYGTSQGFVPRY